MPTFPTSCRALAGAATRPRGGQPHCEGDRSQTRPIRSTCRPVSRRGTPPRSPGAARSRVGPSANRRCAHAPGPRAARCRVSGRDGRGARKAGSRRPCRWSPGQARRGGTTSTIRPAAKATGRPRETALPRPAGQDPHPARRTGAPRRRHEREERDEQQPTAGEALRSGSPCRAVQIGLAWTSAPAISSSAAERRGVHVAQRRREAPTTTMRSRKTPARDVAGQHVREGNGLDRAGRTAVVDPRAAVRRTRSGRTPGCPSVRR